MRADVLIWGVFSFKDTVLKKKTMKIFYTVLYNNEKYHGHTFNIHICHLNNKTKLLTKDVILLIWSLAFDNDMPDLSQTLSRPCCNVLSWMFRLCTKNILNSVSQRWWPATTRWFQARWLLCCVCYSSYCSPSRTIPSFLDSFHTDYSWKSLHPTLTKDNTVFQPIFLLQVGPYISGSFNGAPCLSFPPMLWQLYGNSCLSLLRP